MEPLSFTTFKQVSQLAKNRDLVMFGAGVIAEKTMRRLGEEFSIIFDNNPNLWGTNQLGLMIENPEKISTDSYQYNRHLILICTTSFAEVGAQLLRLGLVAGMDFVVSPILNDLRVIAELESVNTRLLFTSGLPSEDSPSYGGGVYELQISAEQWDYKKVYSGITYGILKIDDYFVVVDDKCGLVKLDQYYNIIKCSEFELGTRAHGIAYSDKFRKFYVVASYMDRILIYDDEFKPEGHISISNKYDESGAPMHHCNDICVIENSLYVSMFSHTGNFKNDIFDGVVLEIDIPTKKILSPVISGLWMPHNISVFNGCLTVLDSLRGLLLQNNAQEIGKFPGFTRGLDTDGVYYYVGQSKNRNYSKTIGISNNISIDTAIIIFDDNTKVSRSIQFPPNLSEIHSILII